MPTYEYACAKCNKTFDRFQSIKDPPLKLCECGKKGRIKRLVGTGAGIIFKGTGFHQTDYRKPGPKSDQPAAKPATDKPAKPAPVSS